MTRYGYIRGNEASCRRQRDALRAHGFTDSDEVRENVAWDDFIQGLEAGDEVYVVALNRISRDWMEATARAEMLDMIGVTLRFAKPPKEQS